MSGDLDVTGDTNAKIAALSPQALLFGPQGRIVNRLQGLVQGLLKAATVIPHPQRIDIGKIIGPHQIAPAYFRRHLSDRRFDVVVEDLNKVPLFTPYWTDAPAARPPESYFKQF